MSDIAANLAKIRKRMAQACQRAGRDPDEVTLVAVSKTRSADEIRIAYEAGQQDFGENYAQELRDKSRELPSDIRWHFIGHLQRNKVKYVVGTAVLIHSVDSAEILEALSERAARESINQNILLELNLSGETTKTGALMEVLPVLVEKARALPGLRLKGLMTMGPEDENPENSRPVFKRLKELGKSLILNNVRTELSMGMSADFEIAIEEGATLIRVGTGIFGPRHY